MILKREKTVFKLIYLITILSQLILEQQDPPPSEKRTVCYLSPYRNGALSSSLLFIFIIIAIIMIFKTLNLLVSNSFTYLDS